jgi:hypothetical protein
VSRANPANRGRDSNLAEDYRATQVERRGFSTSRYVTGRRTDVAMLGSDGCLSEPMTHRSVRSTDVEPHLVIGRLGRGTRSRRYAPSGHVRSTA